MSIRACGWGKDTLGTAGPCNSCVLLVSNYTCPLPGGSHEAATLVRVWAGIWALNNIREPNYIQEASAPYWDRSGLTFIVFF